MPQKKYYDKNKEKYSEQSRLWYQRAIKVDKKRYDKFIDACRRQRYKRYNATPNDIKHFEEDVRRQKGKCSQCGRLGMTTRGKPGLVYDHCHKTDRYRGAICNTCNKVLGLLEENPQTKYVKI